jgi:Delta24-sterol reductase
MAVQTQCLLEHHAKRVSQLQEVIRHGSKGQKTLCLHYGKAHSNTTRSKSYKKGSLHLPCGALNHILSIDVAKKQIKVEPRVTMDRLVDATLPHGLLPLVIPEFKGITVGGAIMGGAAESTSHKWGIFHDSCTQLDILDGAGNLLSTSPAENADLFYALSGSYGSLGLLVSAQIKLLSVHNRVHLIYHTFEDPQEALHKMEGLIGRCDFLDGVIFAKDHAVIVEGKMEGGSVQAPSTSKWYAHQLKEKSAETAIPLFDYLFRYDRGAFWMGAFLFSLPFLIRYIGQGLFTFWPSQGWFTEREIEMFKTLHFPRPLSSALTRPFMKSRRLWGLLHKAEKWVQDRLIIQDFCIPLPKATTFLAHVLKDPGTFPIWLCPLKGTATAQFLAPHQGHPFFINFGIYGSPSYSAPMQHIITKLEHKTHLLGGRKVLYSRSYYDAETFWQIYPKQRYEMLREKTYAKGVWREFTEKVLSE